MAIRLLIVYARSGGTLFNQCLAALPDTVVISEVHKLRRSLSKKRAEDTTCIWGQAKQWYGISLKQESFIEAILELEEYCDRNNLSLIIRDWTFASFYPFETNNFNPSKCMDTYDKLSKVTTVIPFVMVRNALDVWISRGRPDLGAFSTTYKVYIDTILKYKFKCFKYENLCSKPDETMLEVCKFINLSYASDYKSQFIHSKVNGDVQIRNKSRGKRLGKIGPLVRKFILPHDIIRSNGNETIAYCNQPFDYSQGYFNEENGLLNYLKSGYDFLKHKLLF